MTFLPFGFDLETVTYIASNCRTHSLVQMILKQPESKFGPASSGPTKADPKLLTAWMFLLYRYSLVFAQASKISVNYLDMSGDVRTS